MLMSAKIIYEQPNPIPDNNGRTHGPLLQAAAKCFVAMKLLVCWQEGKSFPVCKVDIARLIGAGICTEQGVGQSGDSRMERKWWQGMGGSGLGGDDTKYQFPSCAWSACMEQCRLVQKSELSQIRTDPQRLLGLTLEQWHMSPFTQRRLAATENPPFYATEVVPVLLHCCTEI